MIKKCILYFILLLIISSCQAQNLISVGAQDTKAYLSLLKNKQVALVVNQTSTIGATHLVDSLLKLNITIKTIFKIKG